MFQPHSATSCGIETFEFIVSERVQLSPDSSREMSALTFLLFKLNTLQKTNRQILSQPKPWCNDSGVLNLHYGYYTTIMTSWRLFRDRHNQVSRGTNRNSHSAWKLQNKRKYTTTSNLKYVTILTGGVLERSSRLSLSIKPWSRVLPPVTITLPNNPWRARLILSRSV